MKCCKPKGTQDSPHNTLTVHGTDITSHHVAKLSSLRKN